MAGTLVALAGSAGLLVAQSLAGGVSPAGLLSGPYGLRFGVRESGLVLLLLAALASRRAAGRRLRRLLAGAGAALASVGTALAGHAGAGEHVSITRVLATGAHVGAALAWAGAVVCLVEVLLSRKSPGGDNAASVRVLRAFALPASACVSVMAVTGVYLSSTVVASVDAALFTFYGRALLLKVAVAGVAGLLALANHRGLRRSHAVVPPRRTLVGEAAAVVVAVAATAVLTSAQPATAPALVRSDDRATRGRLDRQVQDLQETLSLRPNRPGRSVALVDVFNTRRPSPGTVTGVSVVVGSGRGVAAHMIPDGHWSADLTLRTPGATTVEVSVHRAGLPDVSSRYRWTVGGGDARTEPVAVSKAPIDGMLRTGAAVLAAGVSVAWLVVGRRRK